MNEVAWFIQDPDIPPEARVSPACVQCMKILVNNINLGLWLQ